MLSVDIMDISGETQFNIMHDVERTRLHPDGRVVSQGTAKGECLHRMAEGGGHCPLSAVLCSHRSQGRCKPTGFSAWKRLLWLLLRR